MTKTSRSLILICAISAMTACSGTTGKTMPDDNNNPIQPPVSKDASVSKYSPRQSQWRGGGPDDETLKNPNTTLPTQSMYTTFNSRTHLIDHFISNTPPDHIPLSSWKNDYIAGELALDAMDLPEAERMFQMCLTEAHQEQTSVARGHQALANIRLALIARKNGDLEKAERLYKESLGTLKGDLDEYERALDVSLYELALINWKQNRHGPAQNYLQERVELRNKQHGTIGPSNGAVLNDLANCLYYQNKLTEADKLYVRALMMSERFTEDSNHSLVAAHNLANCRYAERRYADALALYKRLAARGQTAKRIEDCEKALADLPESERKAKDLPPPAGNAEIWKELIASGKQSSAQGKTWDARKIFAAALKEVLAIDPKDPRVAETKMALADFAFQQGNCKDAKDLYQQVVEMARGSKQPDSSPLLAHALSQIFLCQLSSKEYPQAEQTLAKVKAIADKETWTALVPAIDTMFEKRQLHQADKQLVDMLESACESCLHAVNNQTNMLRATAIANLAHTYQLERNFDKAAPLYQQALKIAEKAADKTDQQLYRLQTDAGLMYMTGEQYQPSETCFKQALALAEKNPGKNSQTLRRAVEYMAALYSNWRRPDQEEIYLKRNIALSHANDPKDFAAIKETSNLANFSRIARDKGDYDKAAEYLEQALKQSGKRDMQSTMRDLMSIYELCGRWDKLQTLHEQAAKLNASPSGQEANKEMYLTAVYALKQGKYESASQILQNIISDMERRNETHDQDFGCYYTEPRYTICLHMLGNCWLDGSSNYDKALTVYDKGIKASKQSSGPSDHPEKDRVSRRAAGFSGPREIQLTAEQLVNLVICCDAIGNKQRADDYRAQLKTHIDRAMEIQGRSNNGVRNPLYEPTTELLAKTKRSKDEEIRLMELVPGVLNDPKLYSGNPNGAELLERVIAWKTNKGGPDNTDMKDDYTTLLAVYICNRRFDSAQPIALRRLELFQRTNATELAIARAKSDYANVLQERGMFALAKKRYLESSSVLRSQKDEALTVLKGVAYCSEMLEEYPEAIKYLKEALSLAVQNSAESNDINVRLGVLNDIIGKKDSALSYYRAAVQDDKKDNYNIYEPLRRASDHQAERKHYEIADALYRRQVELLEKQPSRAIGSSNAFSQLARMYKYARKYDQAKQAYDLAIASLKTNPSDSFCQSQIKTIQQEMSEMLAKRQ